MSFKDIPTSYTKVVINELNDRQRIYLAISTCIEDIAETENYFGKHLTKIGSQHNPTRNELLLGTIQSWEKIQHLITTFTGKQHINLFSNLSQNICKTFPDHARMSKKKLSNHGNRINVMVEEHKKIKMAHSKGLEKYQRLLQDAEQAIKFRDTSNETISTAHSYDGPSKEEGFMNRSFTKMLSKINPTDKKLQDKCKDLLKELEAIEISLSNSSKRLHGSRVDMANELTKISTELEEIETNRLNILKEGLSRIFLALDLMIERKSELVKNIQQHVSSVNIQEEKNNLYRESEQYAMNATKFSVTRKEINDSSNSTTSGPSATESLNVTTMLSSGSGKDETLMNTLYSKLERWVEHLDWIKQFITKAINCILEVAEVEKNYVKGTQKILDRHGFTSSSATQANGSTRKPSSTSLTTSELLFSLESAMNRSGWEITMSAFLEFSEFYSRSVDAYTNQACPSLERILKMIDDERKEVMDKLAYHQKKMENVQGNYVRLNSKLIKVQKELKERRSTVSKARDDSNQGSSTVTTSNQERGGTTPPAPNSVGTSHQQVKEETNLLPTEYTMDSEASDSRSSCASPTLDIQSNTQRNSAATADEVDSIVTNTSVASTVDVSGSNKKKSVMQGFETFGSTFRQPLSVVVGLESTTDRIARIEGKIISLEEEESELVFALGTATSMVEETTGLISNALNELYAHVVEKMPAKMTELKSTLEQLCTSNLTELDGLRAANLKIKNSYEVIDIAADLAQFVTDINSKVDDISIESLNPQDVFNLVIDLEANYETFIPSANSTIEQERARSTTMSPSSAVSHQKFADIVMASKSSQKVNRDEKSAKDDTESYEQIVSPIETRTSDAATTINDQSGLKIPSDDPESMDDKYSKPERTSSDAFEKIDETQRNEIPGVQLETPETISAVLPIPAILPTSPTTTTTTPYAPMKDETAVYELSKFGLSNVDKVLESYSCALYPKKGLLTHGRMFITQHYMAFSGWPDTRVLLQLGQIQSVEKTNTLFYIPNAILLTMADKEEFFFASFIDRDQCFSLLRNMAEVEKRLIEIHGKDSELQNAEKNLEFGFQSRDYSYVLINAVASASIAFQSNSSISVPPLSIVKANTNSPFYGTNENIYAEETPKKRSSSNSAVLSETSINPSVQQIDVIREEKVEVSDEYFDFATTLFGQHPSMIMLHQSTLACPSQKVFAALWLQGSGYRDFLLREGDFDIHVSEWTPLTTTIPEDISKFPFTHCRELQYSHPRTTFLMFGPKNATITQTQFLYIPSNQNSSIVTNQSPREHLKALQPRNFVILTRTQFEGIPMSDVFRIIQYWTFEPSAIDMRNQTTIRVGLHMHFVKSSMFKGQMIIGTKDELMDQVKRWFTFAHDYLQNLYFNQNENMDSMEVVDALSTRSVLESTNFSARNRRDTNYSESSVDRAHEGRLSKKMSRESLQELTSMTQVNQVGGAAAYSDPTSTNQYQNYFGICMIGILIMVLFMQWSMKRSLVNQIQLLQHRMDNSQRSHEKSFRELEALIQSLLSAIKSQK